MTQAQIKEPLEGSPADWFARGFEAGIIDGAGQGIREVHLFRHEASELRELTTKLAKEAQGLEWKLDYLIREMQRLYGETDHNPDRWALHPMYLRGVEVFARMESSASGKPTMQQQFAAEARARAVHEAPAVKPKQTRRKRPEPDSGPTLNLDGSEAAADPDVGLSDEEQMRRAAGRAWRA